MIAIDALAGILLVLALAFVVYGPWQWVCADVARQILFERRDAVFDLACDGHLSFESPQYRTIRRSLEQTIRFAHELTMPRVIYALWVHKRDGDGGPSELRRAIEQIADPAIRERVGRLVFQGLIAALGMAALRSPFTIFVLLPVSAVAYFVRTVKVRVKKRALDISDLMQVEAEIADELALAA